MPSSAPPFIVLGSPRSGTSFLADVLDGHPQLRCFSEMNLTALVGRITEHLQYHGKLSRVGQQAPYEPMGWSLGHARRFLERFLEDERAASGARRIGDKQPKYTAEIPHLEALLPEVQFVHVVRDGRDVAASFVRNIALERHWRFADDLPRTVRDAARVWHLHVAEALAHGERLGPERFLTLRYEDLTAAPRAAAARLAAFLGVDDVDDGGWIADRVTRAPRRWTDTLGRADLEEFASWGPAERLLEHLGYPATPRESVGDHADPAWWRARAAAAPNPKAALADLLAAWRRDPDDQDTARALLAHADHPASCLGADVLFALDGETDPAIDEALTRWLLARGLDADATTAVLAAHADRQLGWPPVPPAAAVRHYDAALTAISLNDGELALDEASRLADVHPGWATWAKVRVLAAAGRPDLLARTAASLVRQPDVPRTLLREWLTDHARTEAATLAFVRSAGWWHADSALVDAGLGYLAARGLDAEAGDVVRRALTRPRRPARRPPDPRCAARPASASGRTTPPLR